MAWVLAPTLGSYDDIIDQASHGRPGAASGHSTVRSAAKALWALFKHPDLGLETFVNVQGMPNDYWATQGKAEWISSGALIGLEGEAGWERRAFAKFAAHVAAEVSGPSKFFEMTNGEWYDTASFLIARRGTMVDANNAEHPGHRQPLFTASCLAQAAASGPKLSPAEVEEEEEVHRWHAGEHEEEESEAERGRQGAEGAAPSGAATKKRKQPSTAVEQPSPSPWPKKKSKTSTATVGGEGASDSASQGLHRALVQVKIELDRS